MHPLTGKIVIVTGASSGIGLATAEQLAASGATIIVAARRLERPSAGMAAAPPLESADIAAAVLYAVSQLERGNVNEILVRPTGNARRVPP